MSALRIALCLTTVLSLAALAPRDAGAQRADSLQAAARAASTPAPPARPSPDSLRPPITPRRAFLYSFVLPGYSQSVLGRHKAAALFLTMEAVSVAMIRESGAEIRDARRLGQDSVVVSYDPTTGEPTWRRGPLTPAIDGDYVRSRRSHLEDWVAILVANHLFAGADAYVAANLWDLPAQLSVQPTRNGTTVSASLSW